MWPEDYEKEWGIYTKNYLDEKFGNERFYEEIIKQFQNSKLDRLEDLTQITSTQQAKEAQHREHLMKKYVVEKVLSNDIFDNLDETTQAKIRLLLGDVYIIPKDKV